MVELLEKEIKIRDKQLKQLVQNLSLDTMPEISSRVESLTTEKQILNKLLMEQRTQQRKSLFAVENGLLLFAIGMFGLLAAFVLYLVSGAGAIQGNWEQLGSEMAVLVLLFVMTSISAALYFQHYKHNNSKK